MLLANVQKALLASGLAVAFAGHVVSQEVKIVVPNGWESRNGNSSTGEFVERLRWQILIPASQFDSLPAGDHLITQIAYRPDESTGSRSVTSTIVDHEIRLSTTSEDNLSRTFAANVGADATVVERSDWTFSTSDGPVGEVQPFNYVVDLKTPFFYDPSHGKNLLYEEFFPRGMSAPAPVDQVAGPVFQIVGNSGTDVNGPATYGPRQVDTPILQFTFVPVDPCDVNRDGVCDADDIDSMTQMLIDGTATHDQRTALIVGSYPEGLNSFFGDANLDGEFNTGDLVQVLGAGKYETQEYASWSEGDWNGDGVFGTGDLVKALDDGAYEMGPREPAAVPEPGAWVLAFLAGLTLLHHRRSR